MNKPRESYRQILRASSIIGSASIINMLLQVVRTKVLAVLLGPAGMGVMGMYSSVLGTASSLSGLGLGTSGVREIAAARGAGDIQRVAQVRHALRWASLFLGAIGAFVVYGFKEEIAVLAFGTAERSFDIGLLSVGLFVSVLVMSLGALLQGYRKIGDQARVQVLSGVTSTVLAILVVWAWGEAGVIYFVIAMPFASVLFQYYYARKIPLPSHAPPLKALIPEIRKLLQFGFLFMLAGVIQQLVLLAVKSRITQDFGLEATGIFQAAWSLAFVYLGIVLSAMGQDYYPRLTEIIKDKQAAVKLVNQQLHVALVLTLPVLLFMMVSAAFLLRLLFSEDFAQGATMMQWMTLGNLMRVAAWPLAYIILASGKSRVFFLTELVWNGGFLLMVWLGIGHYGESILGPTYMLAGMAYLAAVFLAGKALIQFTPVKTNLWWFITGVFLCILLFAGNHAVPGINLVIAAIAIAGSSIIAWKELTHMLGKNPWLILKERFTHA